MNRLAILLAVPLLAVCACGPVPNSPNGGGGGGSGGGGGGGGCTALDTGTLSSGGHVTAGCYTLANSLDVTSGTLTLDPGVTIEAASNVSITIEAGAILNAVGTSSKPILLEGQQDVSGFWMGIGYQGSKSLSNQLSYVTLTDAGSDLWTGADSSKTALFVGDQSMMAMDHSTISKSGGSGFVIYSSAKVDFQNDTVTGSASFPGIVGPADLDGIAASNTLTGNGHDYVEINDTDLTRDTTWHPLDVPILQPATSWTQIHNGATLTIAAGTTVDFGSDAHLNTSSDGTLVTAGTAAKPVTLTGKEATAGFWRGVRLHSPSTMTHTIVEYAGSSPFTGSSDTVADVFLDNFLGTGTLTASDLTLSDSAGYGIYVETGANLSGCSTITFNSDTKGNVGGDMTATDCAP